MILRQYTLRDTAAPPETFSKGASNYKKLRGLRGIMQGVSQRHWQTCEVAGVLGVTAVVARPAHRHGFYKGE